MRRLLSAAAIALALAAGTASAQTGEKVTVATDATFPPFESIDKDGKLVGYDIDLMTAVCEAAELDCVISNAAWEGMIPGLISGKYDALISQLTVTDKRRKVIAFSDIYSHPIFRFVAASDADLTITPEGLADKTIAVQRGTPMDAYVTRVYADSDIKRYDTGSAPYLDLESKRADVVLSYQAQITAGFLSGDKAERYELVGPQLTGADAPEFGEGVAIAISKKNTALLEEINKGLEIVRENGTLDALNAQYFGD